MANVLSATEPIDKKIQDLRSTTFCGRRFKRQEIAEIQTTVKTFTALSRRELAHTICEYLKWTTPRGTNKIQTCLNALEKLESLGIFILPAKIEKKKARQKKIEWTSQTNGMLPMDASLDDLIPIQLQIVIEKEQVMQWNEYIDRYHYLGYRHPIGSHLRYYIIDQHDRKLGCLLFSFATMKLACRDEWIGWSAKQREKHLNLVINNNRFLIFPWVNVKHLASKALSVVMRQIAEDWEEYHGYRPVLLETFVDPSKYKGTCYKAANWQCIGKTAGQLLKEKPGNPEQKDIYVYSLDSEDNMREALMDKKKSPFKKVQSFKSVNVATDSQIYLWQKIIMVVSAVAENFDTKWQKRHRVITTLLIILFIFRLVFSKNKQGYGSTIAELWEYCHKLNIRLPQAKPVTPSAFCNARMKLDESVFKILNTEIIRTYETQREDHRWKNHRIFAVDGSIINLPQELVKDSYPKISKTAHYPQGLMSCLYQLKSEIPIDFELASYFDERALAIGHLDALNKDDIVVYDRGYFSYVLLNMHDKKEIHAVFRLPPSSFKVIDDFMESKDTERVVIIELILKRQKKILKRYPNIVMKPLRLRLIKYVVMDITYTIGTTLIDNQRYPADEFPDIYHSRWGIEELYKVSKSLIDVEDFHAKTERGVKQELFAHFVIITLSKIFSNQTNDALLLNKKSGNSEKPAKVKANMKNCLITIARNLEALFLEQAIRVKEVISTIVRTISTCYQKERPNRSYDRISHKIAKKWRQKRNDSKTATAI